jgi:hypothetical protein
LLALGAVSLKRMPHPFEFRGKPFDVSFSILMKLGRNDLPPLQT